MSTFIPNIQTKDRSAEYILKTFLTDLTAHVVDEETSDVSVGKKYIKNNKQNAKYNEVKQYIDQFGTDLLVSLVTLAEEENMDENVIMDLLFKASYVEPTNGIGRDNFIFMAKIPDEKKINVHISGIINGKKVKDVYETLCKEVNDPDIIDDVQTYQVEGLTFEHDGSVTVDIPQPLYWGVYVDPDKLSKLLKEKLNLKEEDLQKIIKVA